MYSNRVVYDEALVPKKSTNGRYVRFGATSGDSTTLGATPIPVVQTITWNNIQPTSRKNIIKDIRFNGDIVVKAKYESSTASALELIADINRFIDINCTVNGTCNYITMGSAVEPVYKAYIEQEIIDNTIQSPYYSDESMNKTGSTSYTWTIHFSVKLMHPFLYTELGGCYALNIVITTNPGLLGLFRFSNKPTACAGVINNASITYVEYEGASETFIKKVGYMVQYYSSANSSTALGSSRVESNTRNVSGAPLSVYQFVGINGSTVSSYDNTISLRKPLPITNVQISDFCSGWIGNTQTANEMGCVVKISNRMLPININTGEIYRYSSQIDYTNDINDNITYDKSKLYLYTIYEYPALLYLGPEKSTCEYIVNQPIDNVEEYFEEDLYSGSGFFDFLKKGWNWLKDKKIISNGAKIISGLLPGKIGGVASVVGNVADSLGMSTSVF